MKHYTIPVFVPELACPNRCVFCNQHSISGCHAQPSTIDVVRIIEDTLESLPKEGAQIEIGFFGGSFTGIEETLQSEYLEIAASYLKQGKVHGIRLSTRPDYIDERKLRLLKYYGVSTIELGAQSLDEEVLKQSGRGHSVEDVINASKLIISYGFKLGLQMMTGLPGDTPDKSIATAKKIVELGASNTRIYPTLVIKDTELAQRWERGEYKPQTLDEAVNLSASLLEIFQDANVDIIRVGLHPSEDLIAGKDLLDGPFHVSFRQLAETEIWRRKFLALKENHEIGKPIVINVTSRDLNSAIGYNGSNREMLLEYFPEVTFEVKEEDSSGKLFIVDKKLPLPAKNKLRNLGKLIEVQTDNVVYKTISGHPDIFFCYIDGKIITAPCIINDYTSKISSKPVDVTAGYENPGISYPDSAKYNAVVTAELLIHNLKITDKRILENCEGKRHIHVNQGYTRCNLLPLDSTSFLTSDRGIERTLKRENLDVLYVDPIPIVLKGQKHGFFPGCCGIDGKTVYIVGSLQYHPQKDEITEFLSSKGLIINELFDGKLTDVGGILIF